MIIVEGPDGSGKSTLVAKLIERFDLPIHEKFVHSKDYEGTSNDLFNRASRDLLAQSHASTQQLMIYDRHPLVSEYVYGPILRGRLPDGSWSSAGARNAVWLLARVAFVVWCRPPNERLIASVTSDRDMPGVTEHIESIAAMYDTVIVLWPGLRRVVYDYTDVGSLAAVFSSVQLYIAEYMRGTHVR